MSALIELKDVGLKIGGKQIVEKISLQLTRGKITTLIGPNGGGKTSIARILLGVLKPSAGEVIKKESQIKIGYMPQKIEIDKTIPMSVIDFIRLIAGKKSIDLDLITRFELESILKSQLGELSGGQLQKVLFLSSVIGNPDLLVLDEPTQCMDIAAIANFYQLIDQIRNRKNCAILLISHDLHMVMQKTDHVFCVNHHICCHGAPEDINQHPDYLSLIGRSEYLGFYQHHHDHRHSA